MSHKYHLLLITLALSPALIMYTGSSSSEELTQGAMLSNSCAGCHGTDGRSPGSMPTIAGKSAAFIESALQDFRDNKRIGTVMNRHASAYTDEEISLIAEFFATRTQEAE